MKHVKNLVALYRPVAGLSVDRQREACQAVAKQIGAKIAMEYDATNDADALHEWRSGMRSADIAIVAKLFCIPDWRAPKARPTSVFGETLTDFASRDIVLISAMDQVASADGAKWVAAVRAAHDTLAGGNRKLPRKKAQDMARRSHESRADGAVRRWTTEAMSDVRERWAIVWRDLKHSRAEDAFAAMPEDVRRDIGSIQSARRIFGKRRPGDKKAGGRPSKAQVAAKRIAVKDIQQVVYFVQFGKTKQIKIGVASKMSSRLGGLRVGSPQKMTLLATIPGDFITEAEMHRKFRKYHIRGEWFAMEGSLAKFIKSLREKAST